MPPENKLAGIPKLGYWLLSFVFVPTILLAARKPKSQQLKRWHKWRGVTTALLAGLGVLCFWQREAFYQALLYHRPVRFDQALQKVFDDADRLVVRKSGFDCCGPVNDSAILFIVTNRSELKTIAAQLRPIATEVTNSFQLGQCGCCGYPGMDWYKGPQRLALTSVQHGKALRWKGFSTARVLGFTVGYADGSLTPESQAWLTRWLAEHGASEAQLQSRQSANETVQRTEAGRSAQETNTTPAAAGSHR